MSCQLGGVEGETYETADGEKRFLADAEERQEKGIDGRSGMWIPMDVDAVQQAMHPKDAAYAKQAEEEMKPYQFDKEKPILIFSGEEQERIQEIMLPLKQYCREQYVKFIVGDLNMESDWDLFLKTAADMGCEEVVQIYQERYERMTGAR